MDIHAYKMDGLGNDFIIIDNRSDPIILNKNQIIKICEKFLEEDNQMSTIEIEAVTSLISILSETQGFKDDWLIAMENISLSMTCKAVAYPDLSPRHRCHHICQTRHWHCRAWSRRRSHLEVFCERFAL